MRKLFKILTIGCSAWLSIAVPGMADDKIHCYGREYPAKAITVFARSARVEVDLGFGLTYRGIIELDGTKEPDKPFEEWYGKASDALRQKLAGKPITLCVVNGEGKHAYFYVDGENVNQSMIANGMLASVPTPPFGLKTSF